MPRPGIEPVWKLCDRVKYSRKLDLSSFEKDPIQLFLIRDGVDSGRLPCRLKRYIGSPSIQLAKRIAALFRDRLGADIKNSPLNFKIISYFKLKFSLLAIFCSNAVYEYNGF